MPITWGYILEMPRCPSRKKQMDVMKAFGIDTSKAGPWFADKIDKAKRHATAGQTQLVQRNELLKGASHGDTVVIADYLCCGVSRKDAEWFFEQLAERGARVIINGDLATIEPGGSAEKVLDEIHRRIGIWHVSQSRAR